MRDSVLNNQPLEALRMRERQAKADRAAVIVEIEGVACCTDILREIPDDLRDMVECIGKGSRGPAHRYGQNLDSLGR
jgi:hypothetical protein